MRAIVFYGDNSQRDKELDRLLCSFVHGDCSRGEVNSDNEIIVGDIVTKKYDPRDEQRLMLLLNPGYKATSYGPGMVSQWWRRGRKL